MKLVVPRHGHGQLSRGGRRKGSRSLVPKTFREIAEVILNDPDVIATLKRRVLLELAGRKRNPLPALAVLGAACGGQQAKERDARGAISFAVQIVSGRGVVERLEPTRSLSEAEATPVAPGEARLVTVEDRSTT